MKKLLAALTLCLMVAMATPAFSLAWSPFGDVCARNGTGNTAVCQGQSPDTNPLSGSNGLLIKVANLIAIFAGIASIVVIIVGSLHFITSGGDAKNVESARNAVLYALVGLAVIVVARALIGYVVTRI